MSDFVSRPPEGAATGSSAAAPAAERVGFLGLGIMGWRMAANVARSGRPLTVWTHTPGKARRFADEFGAQAVDSPAQVAAASDMVVSMVVDGAQVESILLGCDGVIESAHEGLLCLDMSTIAPSDTRRIGAALARRGVALVDAPVTGSSPRAEDGTLTIMVGGEAAAVARVWPLLELMGRVIVHVGELGQGEMLKLINNALAAANATAVAEALVLAKATGVDLNALQKVVGAGSGGSVMLDLKAAPMRAHDYTTLFKTEHMLKDVRLCLDESEAAGASFPAASHAREILTTTIERGHAEDDFAALIEAVEALAKITL